MSDKIREAVGISQRIITGYSMGMGYDTAKDLIEETTGGCNTRFIVILAAMKLVSQNKIDFFIASSVLFDMLDSCEDKD
jgi:hypothetical protein